MTGEKGFDADAVLPYRERLIVVYVYTEKAQQACFNPSVTIPEKKSLGIGEAYVHDGEWYWWDNTDTKCVRRVQPSYEIKAWTPFPFGVFENDQ